MIQELWAHDPLAEHTLLLAGPNEFLAPEGSQWEVPDRLAPSFVRAYELMGYTRVYPTEREAQWLMTNSGLEQLPPFFSPLGQEPVVDVFTVDGHTVGVVVFPELPPEMQEPTPMLATAVIDAGKALQGQVDLLIGVSSWGKWGEEHFLWHQDLPFDVLLGGGPGPGSWGQLMNEDTILWMRTFFKGRSLSLLHVLKWPEPGQEHAWVLGENYTTDVWAMYDEVPDDPAVRDLFH